ncbi:MAG: hypothetical protein IT186_06490 [Acidobacteria bacterium]|nr:hypothetical protein [Acidobacteriota bacterium]MCK6685273.1 hypothetical protein [Thermoanaerobaculia bacterium]
MSDWIANTPIPSLTLRRVVPIAPAFKWIRLSSKRNSTDTNPRLAATGAAARFPE